MNKYDKIRELKAYEKNDIFIYVFLLILIISLFLFFVILPDTKKAEGFAVYYDGEKVFALSYSAPEDYSITEGFENYFEVSLSENRITFRFPPDKSEYNIITFDSEKKSVKVTESNCSVSPDCVYSPEIRNGGAIICAPHRLKIAPLQDDGYYPPVTG